VRYEKYLYSVWVEIILCMGLNHVKKCNVLWTDMNWWVPSVFYFVILFCSIKDEYKLIKKGVQCDIRVMKYRVYKLACRGCQAGLVSCEHDPGFSNENPVKDLFSTGSKGCLCHLTQVVYHVVTVLMNILFQSAQFILTPQDQQL